MKRNKKTTKETIHAIKKISFPDKITVVKETGYALCAAIILAAVTSVETAAVAEICQSVLSFF